VRNLQDTAEVGISDDEKDALARDLLWEHARDLRDLASKIGLNVNEKIPHSLEDLDILVNSLEQVLVLSYLIPGRSTDMNAVAFLQALLKASGENQERLAKEHEAVLVILSNVVYMYANGDPNLADSQARPIQSSSIKHLVEDGILVEGKAEWRPGMSAPIDPVAVEALVELERQYEALTVYFGHGKDFESLTAVLRGETPPRGTILRPNALETVFYSNQHIDQNSVKLASKPGEKERLSQIRNKIGSPV
jgi:hypothetical protein